MTNSANNRGFTLVELLIAVMILGMIMGIVAGSYYGATMASRRTEARLDLLTMGRNALEKMILEINGAYIDEKDTSIRPFVGEHNGGWKDPQDELNFYTTSFDPRPLGAGSNSADISFFLQKHPKLDNYLLMHRMNPFPSDDPKSGGITYDLAEMVVGLSFRYQDDRESWSERWDSSSSGKLPRMVEITIYLETDDHQTIQLRGMAAPRMWKPEEM